jgi:hypothetical protein
MDRLEDLKNAVIQSVQVGNTNHAKDGWSNTCYFLSKLTTIAITRVVLRLYLTIENNVNSTDGTDTGTAGTSRTRIMCNTVDPGYCATTQNNRQGNCPAARGAVTTFLLATLPEEEAY